MANYSLTLDDYVKMGMKKSLDLVGYPPHTVYEKANWKCWHCGKHICKTYRGVKYAKSGCSCQNAKTFRERMYYLLADAHGITWVGAWKCPPNTKTATKWQGKSGNIVEASYYQLRHSQPKAIMEALGLR